MKPIVFLSLFIASSVSAGAPQITEVIATQRDNQIRFDVTVLHADEGWDHYADGWGVYTLDGTELGYRVLAHPHVNEQPFTRSLTIARPEGLTQVIIRPRDSVHGLGADVLVDLP
ncbi:MAG: hypothetical protein AAF198_09520 [Pseudomonadota bacterium]